MNFAYYVGVRKKGIYMMKKLFALLACCALVLTGCGGKGSNDEEVKLSAGGSTSIQPLMEKLADTFNEEGKGSITVQGGGSSVGTKGAIDGTFDLGMASRELKDDEAKELDATVIALDGIVIVVNKDNKIADMSLEDAKKVFTGEITNWSDLGGENAEIKVVSREEGSGTRDGFESIVGFETTELIENAEIQNATGSVIASVQGNANAIGYISMGSVSEDIKTLTVEGVAASNDTVSDKSYKLQRPFTIATKADNDKVSAFFDFIFSDAGKKIIEDNKYVAVAKK